MQDPMPGSKSISKAQGCSFKRQEGHSLVEFAFVALLFMTLLFGFVEFSRALWIWNTITEATRAGARFAVVQAPTSDDAQIKRYVVYRDPNGGSSSQPVVAGLNESHVQVQYLLNNGSVSASKSLADVIEIRVTGYRFDFLVPLWGASIALPSFSTTLPIEGLGAN